MRCTMKPTVEVLEARQLLAFNVTQAGSLLTLTGTAGDDVVRVQDLGNGNIQVIQPGSTADYAGVDTIKIKAGAGKDDVTIAQSDVATNKLVVRMDLGDGNDKFFADIKNVESSSPENLNIIVWGGAGNDDLFYCSEGPVLAGHTLATTIDGGSGNDNVRAWVLLADTNAGNVSVNLSGGDDQDEVLGLLTHDYRVIQNKGVAQFNLNGDSGDDHLTFTAAAENCSGFKNSGKLSVFLNGDKGNDTFDAKVGASGVFVGNSGTISIVADGQAGDDTLNVNLGLLSQAGPTLNNRGNIAATVIGGFGNDTLKLDAAVNNSTPTAKFAGLVVGGFGHDVISFLLRSVGQGQSQGTAVSGPLDDSVTATAIVNVLFARKSRIHRVSDNFGL